MTRADRVKFALLASSLAICSLTQPAFAQELDAELSALSEQLPGTLINDPRDLKWDDLGEEYSRKPLSGSDIPGGGAAAEYRIERAGANPYAVTVIVPISTSIAAGDLVTAGFWAKASDAETANGKGTIGVRFQQNSDPWPGFGDSVLDIGTEWDWYEFSARATSGIPSGQAVVSFQLAGAKQNIAIGQTIIVKGASSIAGTPTPAAAPPPLAANAALPPQLADKGTPLNRLTMDDWARIGPDGSFSVQTTDQPFLETITSAKISAAGENVWDTQLQIPLGDIAKGDSIVIAMIARTITSSSEDGTGQITTRIQHNSPPYNGFADKTLTVGAEWQLLQFRTMATLDIAAGDGALALYLAQGAQELEIASIYVLKGD